MNRYEQIMSRVGVPGELIDKMLADYREQEYWRAQKRASWGKVIAKVAMAVTAFCLCFVLTMRVVAEVPQIYHLLYQISPSTAQFFMPVQKVSEKNGIRMEVISAYIHHNVAEIYITMEDLEGERIDETIDLYDSYSIHRPFSAIGHCQKVSFDEATGKATFLIRVSEWGGQDIQGDKITFSVREFMSRETEYEYLPVMVDLTRADRQPELISTRINGLGRGRVHGESGEEISRAEIQVLVPGQGVPVELINENQERVWLEEMEFSGIAWSDGLLRIQIRIPGAFEQDHHGYLQLVDEKGQLVDYLYSPSWLEKEEEEYISYQEFVFRVEKEELEKYSLAAHFWITGEHVEGPWQVTFPLEAAGE